MLDPRDNHMLRSVRERILADPSGDYDDALFHSFLASAGLGKEIFNHHHYIEDNGKRYIAVSLSESGKGTWLSLRTFLYSFSSNYVEYDGFVLDGIIIEKDFIDTLPVFQSAKKEDILSLLSLGLLQDEKGNFSDDTRNRVLEALGYGSFENARDISHLHLKKAEREPCLEKFRALCAPYGCRAVFLTSAEKGDGIAELRACLDEAADAMTGVPADGV